MTTLKVYPHKNIIRVKSAGKLAAIGGILGKNRLPPSISSLKAPFNKYKVKYVHGVRLVLVKPAYVYYLKFNFADGVELFKIGYTSLSVNKRIAFFMLDVSTKVTIIETIKCGSAKEAFNLEQLLHLNFKPLRYYGESRLNSGNTELYKCSLV
jgi:hypothetical protein